MVQGCTWTRKPQELRQLRDKPRSFLRTGGASQGGALSLLFFFFPLSFPSCCIWLNLFPFSVCLFSGLERFYFLLTSLVPLYIVTFQLYFSWLITLFSVFSFPRKRLGLWLGCCFYCYKPHQRSLLSSWVRCLHLVKRPGVVHTS